MTSTVGPPRIRVGAVRARGRRGWIFVAPFAVVFALTFLAPLVYAFGLSLFRDQAFFGGTVFVGLGNYTQALADANFWDAFLRVLLFLAVQVPIMLLMALIAAFAIDSARLHAAGFFRMVIFLPYAVPGVVAVLMWGFIYGDHFGLAADLNHLLGQDAVQPLSANWILTSIGNIVTWEFVGYNMLIFYSALKVVPPDQIEAAAIDGAGTLRTIVSVKLPAIRGAIVVATIFSIIGSFQLFNEPNILRSLAPNVITTYFTPNMYAYNLSFAGQQYNYSATVAIVMGVITAIIAYAVQLRGQRKER
ncbi:carbohydrate ABC transporter permease [Kutzneria sp. 744]|uniref:carbohydrate ABC transporter permease n=1 Tax=Kutzneria sp. (strain 744) TaxID=345341 RepID=UPI0003EED5A6|nr:sugar ABC transporter permease [Kutzneria sp. 744]EWM18800.1 multiple sugar transporter permease [Kutzneria sp. 744]